MGEGGRDQEGSGSWDSNSGRPMRNGAICRRIAHEDIGAKDLSKFFAIL